MTSLKKGDPVIVADDRAFASDHYRSLFARTVKGLIGIIDEPFAGEGREPRTVVRWKLTNEHDEVENYAANLPLHALERRFPPGTVIRGPCGYGAEVAEDDGGPIIIIEHYNGDRTRLKRTLVGEIFSIPSKKE